MMKKDARANKPRPSLHELQAQMQAAILGDSDAILASIDDGAHAPRHTLLGVYRHAYMARLVEVLGNEYPFVRRYVGEDEFAKLARAFVTAHPSRTQNARWVGKAFPEYLEHHHTTAPRTEIAELASIERAVSDAFDSADAVALGFDDLAAFAPDDWENLTFALHPSVTLLYGGTNAFDLWKAMKDEVPPPAIEQLPDMQHYVVWRQGTMPKVRAMPYEEAMMCNEAAHGARFGALCQMLATFDDVENAPVRAAQYLRGWIESELLTSAQLAERPRKRRPIAVP